MDTSQFQQTILPLDCTSQVIENGVDVTLQLVPASCFELGSVSVSSTSTPGAVALPSGLLSTLPMTNNSLQKASVSNKIVADGYYADSVESSTGLLLLFFVIFYILILVFRRYRKRRREINEN